MKLDVVTSRAMASLADLYSLASPHVENGALAVFLKGRDVAAELTKTPISSKYSVEISPSQIDPDGTIVRIRRA